MEEQSEIVRSKKEFAFASSTILSQVGRGIIVGLITTQVHNGKSQTVNGSTRMYLGDMIHLVIPKSEIGKVKDLLL